MGEALVFWTNDPCVYVPHALRTVLGPRARPVLDAHEEVLGRGRQHAALVEAQHQALEICGWE